MITPQITLEPLVLVLRIGEIKLLNSVCRALRILGADIERKQSFLATLVDQRLSGIKIALVDRSLAFEEITPASAADGKI